jgi:hypothetical protein
MAPVAIMLMSTALSCRYKQDALCGLLLWGAAATAVARHVRWFITAFLLVLGAYSVLMNVGAAWYYLGEVVWGAPAYAQDNYTRLMLMLSW